MLTQHEVCALLDAGLCANGCGAAAVRDGVCFPCSDAEREQEDAARLCRSDHDSLCRCIESIALARQLSAVHAAGKESA